VTERLLQFLWQFQYFNKSGLATASGEPVQIIFAGQYNTNQGPDFSEAKIKIGSTIWAGNVELHFKTSDWQKHEHHNDQNYRNVILHVVWENDSSGKNGIPILELKEKVSKILLLRYESLMNTAGFIPCANSIQQVPGITWKGWKDRLLAERLTRKSQAVECYLEQSNYHWEETFWWLLARNFGLAVNADAFESIAKSIPLNILSKHKNQIHQLEALLFGQAGLLDENFIEDYPNMLRNEFQFYNRKYQLSPSNARVFFLRMRPVNFPTIRLAQLAVLIQQSAHLFSRIKEAGSVEDVEKWFDVTANDYWHYHYRFDEVSSFRKKKLGAAMIDNIIINTIVPMLFAYGNYHGEEKLKWKAMKWLEDAHAESNTITKGFTHLGVDNKNAFDSQALIELRNEYCSKKRCLDCAIGNAILSNKSPL
jgi:hypothetical protein